MKNFVCFLAWCFKVFGTVEGASIFFHLPVETRWRDPYRSIMIYKNGNLNLINHFPENGWITPAGWISSEIRGVRERFVKIYRKSDFQIISVHFWSQVVWQCVGSGAISFSGIHKFGKQPYIFPYLNRRTKQTFGSYTRLFLSVPIACWCCIHSFAEWHNSNPLNMHGSRFHRTIGT